VKSSEKEEVGTSLQVGLRAVPDTSHSQNLIQPHPCSFQKLFHINSIYSGGILPNVSVCIITSLEVASLENSYYAMAQISKSGMRPLRTKPTKLFNHFMLCFNRRKASVACLWIRALTTILSKNCFFLRLENTRFYISSPHYANYHEHTESLWF